MKRLFLFLVLISVLTYTGCGGGSGGGGNDGNPYGGCIIPSPEDTEIYSSLGGSRVVGVSQFNTSNIYVTITALTKNKLEGYGSPPIYYTGTLSTTTGISGSRVPNIVKNRSTKSLSSHSISGQAKHDLIMRQAENNILASRKKQLSKNISGINFAAPKPIAIGTEWDVKIAIDEENYVLINTTCQYESAHAYFFIDDRDIATMISYFTTHDYCNEFEAIYAMNRTMFGEENDVDGNGKVIIVFTRELTGGLLGYFYGGDKFSSMYIADSNEGDIFYLTTDTLYQGNIIKGTLAHEFQHMIYFDEHYDRGVINTQAWLNEALSQAAEYYNGYLDEHHNWICSYLKDPSWLSLTYWTPYNYGYGAVFIRYLIDRYGDSAIKAMCLTDKVGIAAVEAATLEDFNTIFYNFSRALVLSGTGATTDPKYNFTSLNLKALQTLGRTGFLPNGPHPAGDGGGVEMYPYEIYFTKWTGPFGTIQLSGDLAGDVFGIND